MNNYIPAVIEEIIISHLSWRIASSKLIYIPAYAVNEEILIFICDGELLPVN